jgi:hypothetical protein
VVKPVGLFVNRQRTFKKGARPLGIAIVIVKEGAETMEGRNERVMLWAKKLLADSERPLKVWACSRDVASI